MKLFLRTETLIVLFGLLLAGCERPDLILQKKLVGTWTRGDFFEMTLAPEGKFESKFVGKERETTFTGNWLVSNRWVILTGTGKSERNWTNPISIPLGRSDYFRIISLDEVRLVMAADGQTNTYNRK